MRLTKSAASLTMDAIKKGGVFMARFGPAGNSESFYAEGFKHTEQAPAWLSARGLDALEYSFGRGVRLGEKTGALIAERAREHGVAMSVHAPYFINLSAYDEARLASNWDYFRESAKGVLTLGGKRVVFHPGSASKIDRGEALANAKKSLAEMIARLDGEGLSVTLCPETMGKINQLGDLNEVIALCGLDERLVPAIDFGHLHARSLGGLNTLEDYAKVLEALIAGLGFERVRNMHVHFSQLEFTAGGEKKHHNFDEGFGPDFAPLAKICIEKGFEPVFICESQGRMAEDAAVMKAIWDQERTAFTASATTLVKARATV